MVCFLSLMEEIASVEYRMIGLCMNDLSYAKEMIQQT
jgi:hypothetical protein